MAFDSQTFNYHLDANFFNEIEQTEVRHSDVNVTMRVMHPREDYFELVMECNGTLVIPCDRCLDDMVHEVDVIYEIGVKLDGTEYDDSRDDLLIVPENWRELDVAPLLRDTVLLTIPMTHVHADGECNEQMALLLSDHAAEGLDDDLSFNSLDADDESDGEPVSVDPRWAALEKLKGK